MQIRRWVLGVFLFGCLTPATALADGMFTTFIGTAMSERTYGLSIAAMGRETIGFEFDLGFTPDFFAETEPDTNNNLLTVMGNLIVGVPIGSVRPYAVGGIGIMRSRITGAADIIDVNRNDFGVNFGAGIMGLFSDSVGIRGEFRYFRSLEDQVDGFPDFDLSKFDFWRGSVGLVFRV